MGETFDRVPKEIKRVPYKVDKESKNYTSVIIVTDNIPTGNFSYGSSERRRKLRGFSWTGSY
jgi:hypothetical protein